jgi:hypothetical protein
VINPADLNAFIVKAKAATYVGSGEPVRSSRPGSHDLRYSEGAWAYLDSYFGGQDFIGEEVVWLEGRPVWAMNYYGFILDTAKISPAEAGQVIKASLAEMYRQGRFLGDFVYQYGDFYYEDTNTGDATRFTGLEKISRGGSLVYSLHYHGGLIVEG